MNRNPLELSVIRAESALLALVLATACSRPPATPTPIPSPTLEPTPASFWEAYGVQIDDRTVNVNGVDSFFFCVKPGTALANLSTALIAEYNGGQVTPSARDDLENRLLAGLDPDLFFQDNQGISYFRNHVCPYLPRALQLLVAIAPTNQPATPDSAATFESAIRGTATALAPSP